MRVKNLEEGVARSLEAEHGYKHTAIIHSHDIKAMTTMGRALDTTLFVKTALPWRDSAWAAKVTSELPTLPRHAGEGVTNLRARSPGVRRCVMVDNLKWTE